MKNERIALLILGASILALPWALVSLNTPTHSALIEKRCILAGSIKTANGSSLNIFICWGDVFAPRRMHRDIGFDLVGVSCYFDPIHIPDGEALPGNPLLFSAIKASSQTQAEQQHFLKNLFAALSKSRTTVAAFMSGARPSANEGDQIVPYTWTAFRYSPIYRDQGVKYLSALPLFNPDILPARISQAVARERLQMNVEAVTRRLVTYASDDLDPTVHSIGLAAIGSTCPAYDSPYFLTFTQGFRAILAGLESSRPSPQLDRVYLVAYDQHTGQFKHDALRGLQEVKRRIFLLYTLTPERIAFTSALLTILYLFFAVLSYQNHTKILQSGNRWTFFATVFFFASLATSVAILAPLYVLKEGLLPSTRHALVLQVIASAICLVVIRWLGKHVSTPRFHSRLPRT